MPFGKEILIMLAVLVTAGVWRVAIHEFGHKSSILTSEWQRYSPGQSHLSLLLPGEPQLTPPESPESIPNIKEASRYRYSLEAFSAEVSHVLYREGTSADIWKAADGTASALSQSPGVTEYRNTVTAIKRSGRAGVFISGSFKRDGNKMQIEAVLLGEGSKLWQVIVTHPASDRNAERASRKVLGSIAIDYKGVEPMP